MKLRLLSLAALVAALTAVTVGVVIAAEPKLDGVKCPVSGKAVAAEHTADYLGGKVYFCCPKCPPAFKDNTEKFAAKAKAQLVQTGQLKLANCPITGKAINPEKTIEVAGVKVGLCCGNCLAKMEKADDATKLELAFGKDSKGFEKK